MKVLRRLPLPSGLHRPSRALRRLGALLLVIGGMLLIWPYVTLWRLNAAVVHGPPSALAPLVDIDGIRDQILRRLNKEEHSRIGIVSDPFIEWIEQSMRLPGNETLRQSVSLDWLYALLSGLDRDHRGFLGAVDYAFFEPPNGFLVRIDEPDRAAVYLRMELGVLGWRVGAVYY